MDFGRGTLEIAPVLSNRVLLFLGMSILSRGFGWVLGLARLRNDG